MKIRASHNKLRSGHQPRLILLLLLLAMGLAGCGLATTTGLPSNPATAKSTTAGTSGGPKFDWLQFNADAQHSGSSQQANRLNAANVGQLQKLYQVRLSGVADGAPAYLADVKTSDGLKDLVFATTREGDLAALNAADGSQVWLQHNPANGCTRNAKGDPCYTTSSTALDPNRQFVYSYGLDGAVHKYVVADGAEIKAGGWPALTSRKTDQEKGSSALTIAKAKDGNVYLYATHAYYPDGTRRNQGHVTTINLKDGSQHVFNAVCSDKDAHFSSASGQPDCSEFENGLWARGPVVYLADSDRIFMTSGCCTFDPARHAWSQTVLALPPSGVAQPGGNPLDSYTPADGAKLDEATQLASSAPAILPVPSNSRIRHLGVQSGKDGKLRLLNLDDLSGQGGPGHTGGELSLLDLPNKAPLFTNLAVWVNPADQTTWLYVATVEGLVAYKLEIDAQGNPGLKLGWQLPKGSTSSPIVVDGVLYYVRSNEALALDPLSGNQLWRDDQPGPLHWQSPIVVNGVFYLTNENSQLTAYGLKS